MDVLSSLIEKKEEEKNSHSVVCLLLPKVSRLSISGFSKRECYHACRKKINQVL